MPKSSGPSAVVTIRVTPETNRRLARAARVSRRTRRETARAILETALAGTAVVDPVVEAQRQSRLASQRADEQDVLEFMTTAADLKGWQ